jgi:ABC-type Na+ transport system ATPase subunit NatA
VENVERLCTRVIVLSAGKIVIDGDVDSVRVVSPSGSLEEAFAQLSAQQPQVVAAQIADIVMSRG